MENKYRIVKNYTYPVILVTIIAGLFFGMTQKASAETNNELFEEKFEKSAKYFHDGQINEAIRLLQEAYLLNPIPELFYNFAQGCEAVGDQCCAVDAYRKYLTITTPSDKIAIEQRLAALKNKIVARGESLDTLNCPILKKKRSPYPWIVIGAGVVGLGVGTYFELKAYSYYVKGNKSQVAAAEYGPKLKSPANTARYLFIIGGAVAAAGVVWEVLDIKKVSSVTRSYIKVPSLKAQVGLQSINLILQF